jgi:hypothetical protein
VAGQGIEAARLDSDQMVRRNFGLLPDIHQRFAAALARRAQIVSDTFRRHIGIVRSFTWINGRLIQFAAILLG